MDINLSPPYQKQKARHDDNQDAEDKLKAERMAHALMISTAIKLRAENTRAGNRPEMLILNTNIS